MPTIFVMTQSPTTLSAMISGLQKHIGKAIAVVVCVALIYFGGAYAYGTLLEMTSFGSELGMLVNRNILAPWNPEEERFSAPLTTGKMCEPGLGPEWPSTRKGCLFVAAGHGTCSRFTYGRSCAQISVAKQYFDDEAFREALRVALGDLCASFKPPRLTTALPPKADLPSYRMLNCASGREVTFSMHIRVSDQRIEPPYWIEPKYADTIERAYFSAATKELARIKK